MSRQKEEVLSQESRDELKDAVLQLVSYHYDNTVAVSEVWNYIIYPANKIWGIYWNCHVILSVCLFSVLISLTLCLVHKQYEGLP